jgi:hypothetical protein
MKTKYFQINQHISIKGEECEIIFITTEANGDKIYTAKSLTSDKKYNIEQESDGTIKKIQLIPLYRYNYVTDIIR